MGSQATADSQVEEGVKMPPYSTNGAPGPHGSPFTHRILGYTSLLSGGVKMPPRAPPPPPGCYGLDPIRSSQTSVANETFFQVEMRLT